MKRLTALIALAVLPSLAFVGSACGPSVIQGLGDEGVEHGVPVTPDTLFMIASISKTVAVTAVM